jgi:hypothetical protein
MDKAYLTAAAALGVSSAAMAAGVHGFSGGVSRPMTVNPGAFNRPMAGTIVNRPVAGTMVNRPGMASTMVNRPFTRTTTGTNWGTWDHHHHHHHHGFFPFAAAVGFGLGYGYYDSCWQWDGWQWVYVCGYPYGPYGYYGC